MKELTLAIPCKGSVQARFTMCLFHAVNQIHTLTGYKPLIRFLIGKSNIVHARSILLTEWYDKADNTDLFLFLDSDQIFTVDDIVSIVKKQGDVVCGIYVNGAGFPTCYPLNVKQFQQGTDERLLYCGCGFMLIRKPIVHKIANKLSRFAISRDDSVESSILPFFQPILLEKSEMTENGTPCGDWLGEDYSFCWRVRDAGGSLIAMMSRSLGHEIPQVSFLPDGYFPKQFLAPNPKSIVYFCGHSIVKFCPTMKSLGGSEKAVVELSKAWTKQGYSVQVYGNVWPGTYDGVEYIDSREFDAEKNYNILVLWRSLGASILPYVNARHLWIDLHDYPRNELLPKDLIETKHGKVCVKSKFHRSLVSHLPDSCFFIQPNGLEIDLFEMYRPIQTKKEPLRCVWTSSYDRGLYEFLDKGWPLIRKQFPSATLHVYYGQELCRPEFKDKLNPLLEQRKKEGVFEYGKRSMDEISKEKWKSSYHIYLSEFPEIDCLSIRESVVAECIPICASHAVFLERPCLRLGEGLGDQIYETNIWTHLVEILVRLESDPTAKKKAIQYLQTQLRTEHLDIPWNEVAKSWLQTLL